MKIRHLIIGTITLAITLTASLSGAAPGVAQAAADTLSPLAPTGLRVEQRSATSLRLNWNWTSDQGGGYVSQYELTYLGRTTLVNHNYPGESISLAGFNLQPGNAYTIQLRALDNSGNRSAATSMIFETTPPGQASNVQVVSTRSGSPDFISYVNAPDNSGRIWGYNVYLDSELLGTVGAGTFSLFDLVYYIACIDPHGTLDLQIQAIDSSHNVSTQLSAPLRVFFP